MGFLAGPANRGALFIPFAQDRPKQMHRWSWTLSIVPASELERNFIEVTCLTGPLFFFDVDVWSQILDHWCVGPTVDGLREPAPRH